MKKRLNVFIRKLIETKTVEAENSTSLFFATNNLFYTTPNAMKLILNENRFIELFIHIKYVKFDLKMREIRIFKMGCPQVCFCSGSLY